MSTTTERTPMHIAEIAEAILVARLMTAATVNDTAADALAWLGARRS